MDQKELQEKIALYHSRLPPKTQEIFSSMKWLETLKTISQKYGLNEEQTGMLGTETTLVLLGIIHPVEYEENLTRELKLARNLNDKILMEIEESIIKTVRPQLVIAFEENKKSEIEESSGDKQKSDQHTQNLSEEVKKIVEKSNYQVTLYEISKEYNLTVTQMGFLETAVNNLIVGTIQPEDFEGFLEKNLNMPLDKVHKLVNDINEKIFFRIRELLKLMNTPKGQNPSFEENGENHTNDTQILGSAGIEIIPEKLELTTASNTSNNDVAQVTNTGGEKSLESREDILKKIEKPEVVTGETKKVDPMWAQKLSGSFQTPIKETEHFLENITKKSDEGKIPIRPMETSNPIPQKPKVDPYRMPIE